MGQNRQIKFRSFQRMEGKPSISWQYVHRLEAFHLMAFGYNGFCVNQSIHLNIFANLSPKHQPHLGAEVVIFPTNPNTHPTTHQTTQTAKSKVAYLVDLDLKQLLDPSLDL